MEEIKKSTTEDLEKLSALAANLWTEHTIAELKQEFSELLSQDGACFFIKIAEGKPVGFAQCQLRHDYVEGTSSSPVGYLEGIYVAPEFRHRGYAKQLLTECEKWAKEKGCAEFASDCSFGNNDSLFWHLSAGFDEAGRVICFVKKLGH